MPTYDYLCESCGDEFEHFQSITANALRKCKKCGKMKLKRLIGIGSGIIFKGSGFYQTDYRSDSYKADAKSAKSAESKTTTKKAESKGKESKPSKKASNSGKDKKKTA